MSDTPISRLSILLIVSLVLNGLLVGLLIGGGLSKRGHAPPQMGSERAFLRELKRVTPEAERDAAHQGMRDAFKATRAERRTLRKARQALRRTLTADPYDPEAVTAAFAAQQEAEIAARTGLQQEIARQFESLTPDQRLTVARNLERSHHSRSERKRHFKREERPPQE